MIMKKLISIFLNIIMVLSLVGIASAQSLPLPINGKINGDYVSNLQVKIENLRTAVFKTVITTNSGEYLIDASELPASPYIMSGDIFRVTILSCASNSACVKQITYSGQEELFLTFDLGTGVLPEPEPEPEPEPTPEVVEDENKVTPVADKNVATTTAYYGQNIDIVLDDNKISYLLDGIIYFNEENYDIQENIYFNGVVKTSIDDSDFGLDPYLVLEEYGIEYRYMFDDQIDLTQVTADDPLEIKFLGKDIKIISASANQIVVRSGEDYFMKEGDSKLIDGKSVRVKTIGEDSVLVSVVGLEEIVSKGDSKDVNGVKVLVNDILFKSYDISYVEIILGTETDKTVNDEDYLELFVKDDEEWEWIVQLGGTDQYIGIWNVNTYESIDELEDYKPIGKGSSLSLPNDYVEFKFDSVTSVDYTDLTFRTKDEYLYVRGNNEDSFSFGTKEYDRLYIGANGIYDEDLVLITIDKVEIGDSEIYLEMGSVKISDLTIELDLSDVLYKGVSYATNDEDYLDYLGISFSNPENAVEDKTGFKVIVPEERPEVTIAFGKDIPIGDVIVPEDCPEVVDADPVMDKECADPEPVICEVCTEPTVCPKEKVCPLSPDVPEGMSGGELIIFLIGTLLAGGAAGAYFTRNRTLGIRGGLKTYKGRDGSIKVLHKHPGTRSYHDPETAHREAYERHPKGQLYPHYEKNIEENRWEYKE